MQPLLDILTNPWVLNPLILAFGVALLIKGGDVLVQGAVTIAAKLGVPAILIGLTVVAFGTSAPELALNITAAAKDNPDLAFGNVIGSNIANIGLILGLVALVHPLQVHAGVVRRELPFMLAVTVLTVLLAIAAPGSPAETASWPLAERVMGQLWSPGLSLVDGLVLLLMFALFSWLTIMPERKRRRREREGESAFAQEVEHISEEGSGRSMATAVGLFALGLALLVAGGTLAETGAAGLAKSLGLGDELIGLTVMAISTSLPELFASIAAVRAKQMDIAVGNVVGSNVFNLTLVLGATACVAPVPVPPGGLLSLGAMLLLSFLLLPASLTGGRHLNRLEGGVLLATYLAFLTLQVWLALSGGEAAPPPAIPSP